MSLTTQSLAAKIQNFETVVKEKINLNDNDFSFVAAPEDYEQYLRSLRNGTFKMGLSTGIKALDKYFLFKSGNLVIVNGHDNVGKSVVIWYLSLLSNLLHDWKWIIFSSENSVGSFMRKMIEFYWCESITKISEHQFLQAKKHIESNFTIIRSDEELYTLRDVINMAKKINAQNKHQGLLIDPYNSLAISNKSTLSEHTYHYEALGVLKLFSRQNDLFCVLNCHAITSALRVKDSSGYPEAPSKADIEGGGKFTARADDFITIHRLVQHPDEWNQTQLHIRKIKETETGGHTTPLDKPVIIESVPGLFGFVEPTSMNLTRNPIIEFHNSIRQ